MSDIETFYHAWGEKMVRYSDHLADKEAALAAQAERVKGLEAEVAQWHRRHKVALEIASEIPPSEVRGRRTREHGFLAVAMQSA